MKVALLVPAFCRAERGGAEKGAAQLADLLAGNATAVEILYHPAGFLGPSYPIHESVKLRPLNIHSNAEIRALIIEGYDAIVGFATPGNVLRMAEAAVILRVPFLLQECNSPIRTSADLFSLVGASCKSTRDAFWLRQAILAHASAVRFNNPSYKLSVVSDIRPFTYAFYNSLGRPADGCTVTTTVPSRGVARKIICVGALRHPVKNGLQAVRSFCEFAQEVPEWSLYLYGGNTFVEELAQLRKSFPDARVIECGFVRDRDEVYGNAHALVIPSLDEGMPNVLIEAFSYGVPCIGFSDCPGVRDTIIHGVNGLLADRSDPHSLASALHRISDFELRNELGRNAMAFAEDNFTHDQWAMNWLRMVQNAVEGRNNEGRPQLPPALDPTHPRAEYWSDLLNCHACLR